MKYLYVVEYRDDNEEMQWKVTVAENESEATDIVENEIRGEWGYDEDDELYIDDVNAYRIDSCGNYQILALEKAK